MKNNGVLTNSDEDVANTLNEQYKKSFSNPITELLIQNPEVFFLTNFNKEDFIQEHGFYPLTDIHFTVQDLEEVFKHFKEDSAPGPDGFQAIVLKKMLKTASTGFLQDL